VTIAYPAAVLWDMDGTLVDTEPYWIRAETELVDSFGGTWTHEDALGVIGAGLWTSAKALQDHGVALGADEIVETLTARVREQLTAFGVPWRPGARELLADIRAAGIPTALVTMSVRPMAEQIVAEIPFDAFDLLVTGDEVEHPKPHPDAYLTAASKLGVEPGEAIAIEDSVSGLTSAIAAGTIAVGVPHIVPLPPGEDRTIWPSLVGRSVADLAALARDRGGLTETIGVNG
jgi:HAD superfamily hydrolase (TIGR01509 family)